LIAAYFILRDDVDYVDLGVEHFDRLHQDRLVRYYARRLGELGVQIPRELLAMPAPVIEPGEAVAPTESTEPVEVAAPMATDKSRPAKRKRKPKQEQVTKPEQRAPTPAAALVT
jgi:hypothetical protein